MSDLDKTKLHSAASILEYGTGGLIRAVLKSAAGDLAHVYLQGAHVTHFKPCDQEPLLFLSGKSRFEPGKPIRGGVPIIFPWFGPHPTDPTAPQHGFARTMAWELCDSPEAIGVAGVTLRLRSSEQSRRWLANEFEMVYRVTVGNGLALSLAVTNLSDSPLVFEDALHTYLQVGDVRQVAIEGLAGCQFIDKVDGGRRKVQPGGAFKIEGETDRVYLNTLDTVSVTDPVMNRRLVVSKCESKSTVVWNPWIAKAKAMADFGDDEWQRMLCIETANAADNRMTLAPSATHRLSATLSTVGL